MNKSSTAVNGTAHPAHANRTDANSGQMSKKEPDANKVSLRAKNKDGQGPHHIEEPRQRPLSTISPSDVTPGFNQRRWSADFCTCGNTTCIIVRKRKKQPRPPQRCLALLQPHTASYTSVKRYSCPPVGTFTSPGQSSSSSSTSSCSLPPPAQTSVGNFTSPSQSSSSHSSPTTSPPPAQTSVRTFTSLGRSSTSSSSSPSSSTTSSCSSPPPAQTSVGNFTSPGQSSSSPSSPTTSHPPAQTSVGNFTSPSQSSPSPSSSSTTSSCSSPPPAPTSVIAGPDPRGWKVNPKSSSTSSHLRTNSLSRQIPLPVTPPPYTPNPGPSAKAALTPKPLCRHHSDSSASLRSPRSGVTVEELCAVRLRHVTLSDDDVFTQGAQEKDKVAARPGKIPPPVPEKTAMARQIAQLISRSRQRCGPVTAKSNKNEKIYTGVMKPKPECSQQIVNKRSICVTKTAGLHLHISCDRERSTPHFPG